MVTPSRKRSAESPEGDKKLRRKSEEDDSDALEAGTFYTSIDHLWPVGSSVVKQDYFEEFRRPKPQSELSCLHYSPKQKYSLTTPYQATENLLTAQGYVAVNGRGRSSHKSKVKAALWPVNMFGKHRSGEVAHLLPAAEAEGNTWWFLPELLFGWVENWTWDSRMRAIFGVQPNVAGNPSRLGSTGIVHYSTNKARIPGQGENMDSNPCLLIVPIMDCRRVREWNGEGYEAIVVIDKWEDRELSVVAEETAMQKNGPAAEPEEVEQARTLLLHMVCAISSARKNEPADIADIDRRRMAAPPGRTVLTPSKSVVSRIRVRKVRFVGHALNALNNNTHPAPDPLILAAKAAVVWSTRHEFKLAAGAEPQDDGWTDLDDLAAEQYLAAHEASLRAQTWGQLASGLGQPNGFQRTEVG
jgi:hypothetical protein